MPAAGRPTAPLGQGIRAILSVTGTDDGRHERGGDGRGGERLPGTGRAAVTARRDEIVDVLRQRVLRGRHAGALHPGDRLPSARELERDFEIDHRVILTAYRQLADEGLVELRQRGGIYVAGDRAAGAMPMPPEGWLIDVLLQGIAREVPVADLAEWLRRAVGTLHLRTAVVASTADQGAGIVRELRDEYGVDGVVVDPAELDGEAVPPAVRHADLLVTTPSHATQTQPVAAALDLPCIVVTVRPDLVGSEWRLLLRRPVYVVVADGRFVELLRGYFADTPGAENLRPLVVGRDDLGAIPPDAPTYTTRAALDALGDTPVAGRQLPAARIFSAESARELVTVIVRRNLDALAARRRG